VDDHAHVPPTVGSERMLNHACGERAVGHHGIPCDCLGVLRQKAGQSLHDNRPDFTKCLYPHDRVAHADPVAAHRLTLARRDEGATAVNGDDQPFFPKLGHSAAYGHPGHSVLLGQFCFAWQPRIRREPPSPDITLDVPSDLSSHGNGRIVTYPVRSFIQRHADHAR
jgi:hypothetical protein